MTDAKHYMLKLMQINTDEYFVTHYSKLYLLMQSILVLFYLSMLLQINTNNYFITNKHIYFIVQH